MWLGKCSLNTADVWIGDQFAQRHRMHVDVKPRACIPKHPDLIHEKRNSTRVACPSVNTAKASSALEPARIEPPPRYRQALTTYPGSQTANSRQHTQSQFLVSFAEDGVNNIYSAASSHQ
jgi:hypothetical protein